MTDPIAVPEKLSDLIRLAIADGRKLYQERAGEYLPHADVFHKFLYDYKQDKEICHICLAGVVMAGTLHTDTRDTWMPINFHLPWTKALRALDSVRVGHYRTALLEFYGGAAEDYQEYRRSRAFPVMPRFQGWDEFLDHLDSLGFVVGFFQDHGY